MAKQILAVVPRVMRAVAAELRTIGELPAPAHFSVLTMLAAERQALTLTDLAIRQGVSLPTMSNTVTAMADRGWVRRVGSPGDRRIVHVALTGSGRASLRRVGRAAEAHLATLLAPLDAGAYRSLQSGLEVLTRAFSGQPTRPGRPVRRRVGARAAGQ